VQLARRREVQRRGGLLPLSCGGVVGGASWVFVRREELGVGMVRGAAVRSVGEWRVTKEKPVEEEALN
jgi:hypothetical protein